MLSVLLDHGPLRQVDVAEMTSIKSSTLSRLVGRVVRRGLVTRTRSSDNSREVVLQLTSRGVATLDPLRAVGVRYEELAIEGLSKTEIQNFKRYLRHVHRNVKAIGKKPSVAAAVLPEANRRRRVKAKN